MRRAFLAAAAIVALCTPSLAKGPYDLIKVGNWAGGAYTNDETGQFSHCAASVNYIDNGGDLFVWIDKEFVWSIGVFRKTIKFAVGNSVPIEVSFDNVGPFRTSGVIRQEHFFIANLPGSAAAVEAFKAANFIFIKTPSETIKYSLLSTRKLMPALLSCVNSHLTGAPNVSSASPAPPTSNGTNNAAAPSANADAMAAREKLFKQVGDEYTNCINTNMKEILPYSNEGAETIAQVILTKCFYIQNKFVDLMLALSGGSRESAEKLVSDSIAERKKAIVADIVTFRAELTKTLMSQPKNAPTTTPTPAGQGL